MRFLWVPDSFKGSMNAKRVCEIGADAIKACIGDAENDAYPAFDGGEGSVENLVEILHGEFRATLSTDGNFEKRAARYGVCGDMAVIAVANTSGLPDTKLQDPRFTTTYGFGEQIADALSRGYKKIVLALGGSSTNDGGAGAAAALGAVLFRGKRLCLYPYGRHACKDQACGRDGAAAKDRRLGR